ncbi:hypothetical protein AVEN_52327-1 [Araneus ventricosus]|uniref:Uncharacterized protein n=1 Tax=Araneus ventricosus TaxID=182803 RepID=A0A4Y2RWA6_ARAVE|nr:hypothetical protein AVEN_52327-1 [Araneus ventricosus]
MQQVMFLLLLKLLLSLNLHEYLTDATVNHLKNNLTVITVIKAYLLYSCNIERLTVLHIVEDNIRRERSLFQGRWLYTQIDKKPVSVFSKNDFVNTLLIARLCKGKNKTSDGHVVKLWIYPDIIDLKTFTRRLIKNRSTDSEA